MAVTKTQQYFQRMLEIHADEFTHFRVIHDKYSADPKSNEKEFNLQGEKIQEILREWENKLCNQSEGSGFGKFSSKLADKFWEQVRFNFPKIDFIGVVSS